MAELGVISGSLGIVSLAIQVSDSMMKLKGFLNSIKDAPDEIKYTIKQIETLNMVLSTYDISENDSNFSGAASTSRRACNLFLLEAVGQLNSIVQEMGLAIGKRRNIGSFKTVLKRDMIERLKQRLRDAQDFLLLSNQYYSQTLEKRLCELQKHSEDIQIQKLSSLQTSVSQCTEAVQSIAHQTNFSRTSVARQGTSKDIVMSSKRTRYGDVAEASNGNHKGASTSLKRQERTLARLQLPSWLGVKSCGLTICTQRHLYGLSLDVKMHRVVSCYAPIMRYAREGNVAGIQTLFSKRMASPNDRIVYDLSVLDVAAIHCQVEVCRLLIDCGAHQNARSAYQQALYYGNPLHDPKRRVELLRILTNAVEEDDFFELEAPRSAVRYYFGDSATLSWVLKNVTGYTYQNSTLEDRTKLAIFLCSRLIQPRAASLVRCLLPTREDIINMCKYKDSCKGSLLHACGWALGEQSLRATQTRPRSSRALFRSRIREFRDRFEYDVKAESESLQDLLLLIKELILVGSDLHACAQRAWIASDGYKPECIGETPLSTIISGFSHLSEMWLYNKMIFRGERGELYISIPKVTDLSVPIRLWLQLLYDAGIDLVNYGRKEKLLRRKGQTSAECRFVVWRRAIASFPSYQHNWRQVEKIFSISFTYGPKPSDWQFWFIEQLDDSFAYFWDMIDHPERSMPGAWNENEDEDLKRYFQRTRRPKVDCGE